MYRNTVNPNVNAPNSCTGTNPPNRSIFQLIRHLLNVLFLTTLLLVSTSYLRSPKNLENLGMEYFAPAAVDSLRSIVLNQASCDTYSVHGVKLLIFHGTRKFYLLNGFKPVWTNASNLNKRGHLLLDLIENARAYGLEPGHYHLPAIRELQLTMGSKYRDSDHIASAIKLDFLLTDAALCLMVNLHTGYTSFDSTLFSQEWFDNLPSVLHQGVKQGHIQEQILSVQPEFIEYVQLQRATEKFVQTIRLTDQQAEIRYPASDSAAILKQVGEALTGLGYLRRGHYRNEISEALRQFQHYHGLEPDGKLGRNTVEAIGQSTLYRYTRLALNLDRLRKQATHDSALLYVNIPAYQLRIYNHNSLIDTFRVIVGHPSSPTPQLTGSMKKIIANPVWYVPKSITMNEILPKIKSDSGYLKRNGFKILDQDYKAVCETSLNLEELSADNFNYTIRQNRGSDNALGKVKFVFSNPYSIYLHDTPSRSLFSKDIRAFSHGCVRVKDPERLAGYIVRDINKEALDMTALIRNGKHYEVDISASLPIYIRYITCEADQAGNVYFYKDIYGLDKKELKTFTTLMGI